MSDSIFEVGGGNPADERKRTGYNFCRVPAHGTIEVVSLSRNWVHFYGHFSQHNRGRMEPCLGPACQEDHSKCARQDRYVLAVKDLTRQQTSLMDMTAAVADVWQGARERFQTLRGVGFEYKRLGTSVYNKIQCRVSSDLRYSETELPDEPDVVEILTRIWRGWGFDI